MARIYFDVEAFTAPLPNGLVSPTSGRHRASMARLVWAAATIGTTPFGPRLGQGRALEMQWREAMMRASIQPGATHHMRSRSYARLDPSEKGAVSFFLGQAQAKLFAYDFFRVSRFVHYDSYLAHRGQPRRNTRPDFLGFFGRHIAIGVEAKGRSNGFERTLITKAKRQASSLPMISGHPASATYVHVAYFDQDQWCAYLEDPPRQPPVEVVDPAILTLVYYLPIVNAIRAREWNTVTGSDNVAQIETYFPEIDSYLSVRSDVAALVPSDETITRARSDILKATSAPLYQLALSLDAASEDTQAPELRESEFSFSGGDGVTIRLGPSWEDWLEARGQ